MIGKKVLICDDAAPIRITLQKVMTILGVPDHHVFLAKDGQEAVALFKEHRPGVVFMDLLMPNMDGEEAARQILEIDPTARIILVTGSDRGDEKVRRVVSDGAFDVLEKPVRLADVSAVFQGIEREELGLRRVS